MPPRTLRTLTLVATAGYTLWGVLHIGLGAAMLSRNLGIDIYQSELAAESTMFFVSAVVFGAQAVMVAVTLNRRNDRVGHWLNLTVLGAVDAAFIAVMLVPGHVGWAEGVVAPLIWLAAACCAAAARRGAAPARAPRLIRS
ncbi:hypothetical protein LX16_3796 [Stackebrandtia albiflava]|uniref:Uncharacterized protein n=1 Tax=Stackebrandtia albiflava TaxID=406432 RepID=A0A562V5D4_9ACTN|nr:hypothetical protein [Stackebrandtia albiflava]TWJ13028.1 hypothetical protein LX16_3796 [Stackebrandtia albiflava]